MTRKEAIRRIVNHIRIHSKQEPFHASLIQEALEMAVDALKAQETSLERLAEDYGLTVDGVQFALEQYQTVICEITHGRMSKLSYYARDILSVANDVQCNGCELKEAQEPIRPNEIRHGDVLMYYQCPACTSALRAVDRYCSQCGRKVKWDG